MILDTRNPIFFNILLKHLDIRLDHLLELILTQKISPKARQFETNCIKEIKNHLNDLLPLIAKTEKSLENEKILDRSKIE